MRFAYSAIAFALLLHGPAVPAARAQRLPDAAAIIKRAIDYWRGTSSFMQACSPALDRGEPSMEA